MSAQALECLGESNPVARVRRVVGAVDAPRAPPRTITRFTLFRPVSPSAARICNRALRRTQRLRQSEAICVHANAMFENARCRAHQTMDAARTCAIIEDLFRNVRSRFERGAFRART
jgi:hypothetical protein